MEILQKSLPYDPTAARTLPGVVPLDPKDWLHLDDAYEGQMQERARLLAQGRSDVLALDDQAKPAADELLETVLGALIKDHGHSRQGDHVHRPDGSVVEVLPSDPMGSLGRLVQEDFCILEKEADAHILTGALLCFPASWRLSEKFMRPLIGIHAPVASYDDNIARRVQRLFDGLKVGRPLWRFNVLWYDDPALYQPRSAVEPRVLKQGARAAPYLRSERQCLWRLPKTNAVVFSIHTYVVRRRDVPK